ncbi:MAG TPA: 6-phosphogluconolactonase [Dehalococcoidia bacterium]|nr:6-phosphogluconolactonase [Dehalococcoidia bacterium]
MAPSSEIIVRENPGELAVEASDFILREIQDSSARPFFLALAGGSTPAAAYRELAELPVDWSSVQLFLSDERYVPVDDPNSNFGVVRESLLDGIDVTEEQVHAYQTDRQADEAALSYEREIRKLIAGDAVPAFDLLLLGIGANGHTASLFPGEPEADENKRLVMATKNKLATPPRPPLRRLTFTFPLINAAKVVAVIASGEEKAEAVGGAMRQERPDEITASRISPAGRLVWLLDRAAASRL